MFIHELPDHLAMRLTRYLVARDLPAEQLDIIEAAMDDGRMWPMDRFASSRVRKLVKALGPIAEDLEASEPRIAKWLRHVADELDIHGGPFASLPVCPRCGMQTIFFTSTDLKTGMYCDNCGWTNDGRLPECPACGQEGVIADPGTLNGRCSHCDWVAGWYPGKER